jgi:magnesium-transporting ATPase (P-type)
MSQIERKLNFFLFFNICVLFVLSGIMSGRAYHWIENYGPKIRYIYPRYAATLLTQNIPR